MRAHKVKLAELIKNYGDKDSRLRWISAFLLMFLRIKALIGRCKIECDLLDVDKNEFRIKKDEHGRPVVN